jgi:hypothetical protein
MYWFGHDRTPARLDSARVAVDRALRLAPELAEARIARGYLDYWGRSDYPRALAEFEAARRQQPGNSELLTAIGYVERRRGQWDTALARFEEAVRYDPRSALRALDLADTYMSLRRYPEAERAFDRAIQLSPDWAEPWAYKAMLQLIWRGDLERARTVMAEALHRVSAGRLAQALTIPDAISGSLLTADTAFAGTLGRSVPRRSTATRPATTSCTPNPPPSGAITAPCALTRTRRCRSWSGRSGSGRTTPSSWCVPVWRTRWPGAAPTRCASGDEPPS